MNGKEQPDKKEERSQTEQNPHAGHRQRMKEKFMKCGINAFSDYQALEFLMFYIHKRKDTNIIGHDLINEFKNLEGVFGASYESLIKVKGIGPEAALLINFIGQLRNKIFLDSRKCEHKIMVNTTYAGNYFCDMFRDLNIERFMIMSLKANREIIATDTISEGTVTSTSADLRTIAEMVFKRKAAAVIIAHNHPSGNVHPSGTDIALTKRIVQMLELMDVAVIDHIICSGEHFTSMFERGFMDSANGGLL